jgi:hypothetical protein
MKPHETGASKVPSSTRLDYIILYVPARSESKAQQRGLISKSTILCHIDFNFRTFLKQILSTYPTIWFLRPFHQTALITTLPESDYKFVCLTG